MTTSRPEAGELAALREQIEGIHEHSMRQGTWGIEYGDDRFMADVLRLIDKADAALTAQWDVEQLAEAIHDQTCREMGFGNGYFDSDHIGSSTCQERAIAVLAALAAADDRP